jgi:hypothetical protein
MSLVTFLKDREDGKALRGLRAPDLSNELYYVASPISHRNGDVIYQRFLKMEEVMALLMMTGLHVYVPAVHHYRVVQQACLPRAWSYWRERSLNVLRRCTGLIVVELPGWMESTGVTAELDEAARLRLDVSFLRDPGSIASLSTLP